MKRTCIFLYRERTFEDCYVYADMTFPYEPLYVYVNAGFFWTGKNVSFIKNLGEPR